MLSPGCFVCFLLSFVPWLDSHDKKYFTTCRLLSLISSYSLTLFLPHSLSLSQGAGRVLCEWKHFQGAPQAVLHQKPKIQWVLSLCLGITPSSVCVYSGGFISSPLCFSSTWVALIFWLKRSVSFLCVWCAVTLALRFITSCSICYSACFSSLWLVYVSV